MKLYYTDGCTCTSLTVDGKETIDIEESEMKEVLKKMIKHVWKPENKYLDDLIKYIIQDTGEHKEFKFGEFEIFDEIEIFKLGSREYYLTYINVPTSSFLVVNKLVCEYSKLVRQERWDPSKHVGDRILNMTLEMIDLITDFAILQGIFCKIMSTYGTQDGKTYHCSCCGDTVRSYKMTI